MTSYDLKRAELKNLLLMHPYYSRDGIKFTGHHQFYEVIKLKDGKYSHSCTPAIGLILGFDYNKNVELMLEKTNKERHQNSWIIINFKTEEMGVLSCETWQQVEYYLVEYMLAVYN